MSGRKSKNGELRRLVPTKRPTSSGGLVFSAFLVLMVLTLSGLTVWNFIWTAGNEDAIALLVTQVANLTVEAAVTATDVAALEAEDVVLYDKIMMEMMTRMTKDMILMNQLVLLNSTVIGIELTAPLLPIAFAQVRVRATDGPAVPLLAVPAIQPGSFNVAGVARISTGLYSVTFANPAPALDYTVVTAVQAFTVASGCGADPLYDTLGTPTTTMGFGIFITCASFVVDPNEFFFVAYHNTGGVI